MGVVVLGLLAVAPPATPPLEAQSPVEMLTADRRLRPGDMIRLRIWREPELSGEFPIDAAGTVVFPQLGEVRVMDFESTEALEVHLTQGYQRVLRNPSIEITVLRRVSILGAVTRPGLYHVDPTVSVADALAMAGGATIQGNPDQIQVIRDGQQVASRVTQNTLITDSPIRSGDQLFVPERSWVARNAGVVGALISASVSLVIALALR
ncbi:MAG: polysaccharide biosynthesis/export family protein [Gemmatimonadota bacterium]